MVVDPIVTALQAFSTCDISDALLKLKQPHGGFLADLVLWSPKLQDGPTKIIGPAYTVKYVRHSSASEPMQGHYIDSVPPGAIIFVSAPPNIVNAVYGGLMSQRAKVAGAVGTIVDGRIRDLC